MVSAVIAESPSLSSPEVTLTHVVGIGASAGGLNALEQFFDNMPPDTGMAFVVIQHLSPDFKSLMDDLLSRHTAMPIHRVTNGVELAPNSIFLIPPKTHMTVSKGKLYLTEKNIIPPIELPIDIFFNSLAEDLGERAVGVVLSGTGSDGSRGIVSINKNGGLVVVQAPESAQFDGMPRSAISTGVADFILAPDRIPRILVEYAISPLVVRTRMSQELEVFEDEGEFAGIFALLRRNYNLDFSKYKGSTVGRRIRRRMEFRQIPEISDYVAIVSGDQGELEQLYKDLLIGVTEFFRDKQAFQLLEQEVIPRLFANSHQGEDLRVWSAGCATGEEAYSLAILLAERSEKLEFNGKITVFATDVHKSSLDYASQGLYDRQKLTNVSPERLDRYFKKEGIDLFRVTSELRKMVVFAPHNLLNDPPFTRLDLVCCRNMLIYFQSSVQERVISLFHFALKIDGILFLGSSEGLGPFVGEFEVIANQHKLFRKIRDLKLALNLDANRLNRMHANIPVTPFQPGSSRTVSIDRQVLHDYDTLLLRGIPPGVLIDENHNIIHYFGNVSEYLKAPTGRTEHNILTLAEDSLHIAISTSLQRADKTRQHIVTKNVRVRRGSEEQLIDLSVAPIPYEKNHTTHYHVYFERVRKLEQQLPSEIPEDLTAASFDIEGHFRQHMVDLEMELQSTRENLQATVEELQTSNEELQATNEELLAANEELQSTNEELHSVNEELYSVNSEFERKNFELKQLNNDHENLLASTDIGTVFLDRQLRIRKFNPAIASFFKLLPQDVGRPIDHIAYHLSRQEEMLADIGRVIANGNPIEMEEKTRDNCWLLKRIMPFRSETGQVEGVVITFTDITTVKSAELKMVHLNDELEQKVEERTEELREKNAELLLSVERFQRAIQATNDGLWEWDMLTNEEFFAPRWCEILGYAPDDPELVHSYRSWEEKIHPDDHHRVMKALSDHIEHDAPYDVEYRHRHKSGEYRWQRSTGMAFSDASGKPVKMVGCISDISERKAIEDVQSYLLQISSQNTGEDFFESLARYLAHTLGMDYVCIDRLHGDCLSAKTLAVYHDGEFEDNVEYTLKDTPCGDVVGKEVCVFPRGVSSLFPQDGALQELQAESYVGTTLWSFDMKPIGLIAVIGRKELHSSHFAETVLKLVSIRAASELERRQAEAEKYALEQQFQQTQKLESLGVLAGGIAHDFNNILAIIVGYCELIEMEPELVETTIPEIVIAAERGAGLCRQMLDYAGKSSLVKAPVNMTAVVDETVKMLKSTISQNVTITTKITPEHLHITGDDSQIRQIVMNLVINASEAIGEAQGSVTVALERVELTDRHIERDYIGKTVPKGEYIRLEVSDSGIGMDEETRRRIFEPFFTTKFTGRGLGMSAVIGILSAHSGFIQLSSQPDQGTTFRIYLPFEGREKIGTSSPPGSSSDYWRGSGAVLLVEDEIQVRIIAEAMLKKSGFTVIAAENGREALDLYQKNVDAVTLVLTDIGMPVMNGYELITELKKIKPQLPIIAVSGFGKAEVTSRIAPGHLAGLISKPYNFEQLREVLKSVLEGAH